MSIPAKQQEYKNELLAFAKRKHQDRPIEDPKELTEQDWHRRIIGGSLVTWLDQRLPGVLAERRTLKVLDFDQESIVVFATTPPGVAAARDIMRDSREDFVYLLHEEFEHWQTKHRDDGFKFHIHYWSYFDNPSPELHEDLAEAYPWVPVDQLRFHRTGDVWGPNCGVFADHLWQWTGESMELLMEAYSEGVY